MQEKKETYRILTINPGSTSTKFGIYDNETSVLTETIRHNSAILSGYGPIPDQKDFRKDCILEKLEEEGYDCGSFDAIAGRGGIIKPIPSGVYAINRRMIEDLQSSQAAMHASALGGIIAKEIADPLGIPSYIVDPVVVYEMDPVTKLSGMPEIERVSIFHALNQKAIARRCAAELGKPYEECRFVVAHLGGGISVGAHRCGKVIDVNDGLKGEGPFSPERSGGVPAMQLIDLCYSGNYTRADMKAKIAGKGGILAYLKTADVTEVLKRSASGDASAAMVLDSMCYQVSKEIGAMAAALEGDMDAIVLTGGIAYSERITDAIKKRVGKFAPVKVFPGEDELLALASGVLRVLRGTEKALEYV